ncbi:YbaK/EbsC family protein [Salinifilum ghardaiensis]
MVDWNSAAGHLHPEPAPARGDALAEPAAAAVRALPAEEAERIGVADIDPELADTAAFCEQYASPLELSANCVVVSGKRAGEVRHAGCVVLATTRLDVNATVCRRLDVRKASFTPMDEAVELTGMAYGGITPLGLPREWPLLVDKQVVDQPVVVIGSGARASKLFVPGELLGRLPNAEVLGGLAS